MWLSIYFCLFIFFYYLFYFDYFDDIVNYFKQCIIAIVLIRNKIINVYFVYLFFACFADSFESSLQFSAAKCFCMQNNSHLHKNNFKQEFFEIIIFLFVLVVYLGTKLLPFIIFIYSLRFFLSALKLVNNSFFFN